MTPEELAKELAYAQLIIKMTRDSLVQDHSVAALRRLNEYLRTHQ